MKPITLNTADASGLHQSASRLLIAASDQSVLTKELAQHMLNILNQPATEYGVSETRKTLLDNLIYISPKQRTWVLFLIEEAGSRCEMLYDMARSHMGDQTLAKVTSQPSRQLEDIIASWQAAHQKWRGRLDIGDENDNPESKAEDLAAEALLNYQCRTHADVQRKLSLFASINHLGSLVGAYPETFLPTVILQEGGAL